jgi:protocatechuate 3,4-dioxygenase beta subunit
MRSPILLPERRLFLAAGALALASPFYTVRGAFAEELTRTPDQTKGPFYPTKLPLDTDNDLIVINDNITPAVGTIAHVSGKVLDAKGNPLKNAVVEIWQCDSKGAYLHPRSDNYKKRDANFQGFGRFVTGSTGEYYFRTIKPVPYPGRTPHIHFLVKKGRKELLATQLYVKGEKARNQKDGIWRSVKDAKARDSITVDFASIKGSKAGELAAKFDVVLGVTPAE